VKEIYPNQELNSGSGKDSGGSRQSTWLHAPNLCNEMLGVDPNPNRLPALDFIKYIFLLHSSQFNFSNKQIPNCFRIVISKGAHLFSN
jgi:hypothetical protein